MQQLNFISPLFIVDNLKDAVSFYIDKLGFKLLHITPGDAPFFAMLGRDNAVIMLKKIADDINPVPNHTRHKWARLDAFISTTEPDALFEEFRSRGITFRQSLMNDDDGLRGFEIADADGYVLFFGRPV